MPKIIGLLTFSGLRRLLASIGIPQTKPTTIFTDSQSAMGLAVSPEFHSRTKHVDVKFHFLREPGGSSFD